MKTVIRLVTEDINNKDKKGDPKWVYNDYYSTTSILVNGSMISAGSAKAGDVIKQGTVIKAVTFNYEDSENPQVLAA